MSWWWTKDQVQANIPWGIVHWRPFVLGSIDTGYVHDWILEAISVLLLLYLPVIVLSAVLPIAVLHSTEAATAALFASFGGFCCGVAALWYADVASSNAYDIERLLARKPRT